MYKHLIGILLYSLAFASIGYGENNNWDDFWGREPSNPYMVTIGDSITSGLFAEYSLDNPPSAFELGQLSYLAENGPLEERAHRIHMEFKRYDLNWSSGDNPRKGFDSHFDRLSRFVPNLEQVDAAHSGDTTHDFMDQFLFVYEEMSRRNREPHYVTTLLGANDICADDVDGMTNLSDFRSNMKSGLSLILWNTSETKVLVSSIPNVFDLQRFKNERVFGAPGQPDRLLSCVQVWESIIRVCNTGTDPSDPERWNYVKQILNQYNKILGEIVNEMSEIYPERIKFASSVFGGKPTREDVSFDCFHPTASGHKRIADATWEEGFWPTK